MNYYRFFLLLCFLTAGIIYIFFGKTSSSIQSIDSFSEISWEKVGIETLVIFDVDDVLIMASDKIYQTNQYNESLRKKIADSLRTKYDMSQYFTQQRISLYLQQGKKKLVEPEIVDIIHRLQDRGIKTIALSNSPGGSFGYIPKMEEWRANSLKSLEIDFSQSFPECAFSRFTQADLLGNNGEYALISDGIILTNGFKKSKALSAFLKSIPWQPMEIVYIDDSIEYLQDVQSYARENNISFKGYFYNGVKVKSENADENIAAKQIKNIIEHQCWLSDEDVQKELKKRRP